MEHYYFHLRPLHLTRPPRRRPRPPLPPAALQFRLQVEDEQPIDSALCPQADFVQDCLKCSDCLLDFRIQAQKAKQGPLISLTVLLRVGESQVEMGSCQLDGGIYVDTFNSERKSIFQENVEIASELSLDYEVYIAKSRFALEKLMGSARGIQNPLQSAFKKRQGQRKVRCVEFDRSRERSVQEEEFQRAHGQPASSLKRNGLKFSLSQPRHSDDDRPASPTSPTYPDYPSSPTIPTHDRPTSQQQPSSLQNISLLKTISRPQNNASYLQANTSWVQGNSHETTIPKMLNRHVDFDRSMVMPHYDHQLSMIENNRSWDLTVQRALLTLFWTVSLVLLYLAMTPSRKT